MIDPCAPHSVATIRAWRIWGRAHAFWHAPKFGPCVKAGSLALPLLIGPMLPGAWSYPGAYPYPGMGGFPAAGATEGYAPAFGGPLGPIGAWFPQAVGFTPPTAAVSAGLGPAEVGTPPLLSGPTAAGGSPATPVNTPEPSSLVLLGGLLVLVGAVRRWV